MLAERKGDVVVKVHRAEQGAVLEQHPHVASELEQLVLVEAGHALPGDPHVALIRVQQPDHVAEQHALARPGRSHHDRNLAGGNPAADAFQHLFAFERLVEAFDLDHGLAALALAVTGWLGGKHFGFRLDEWIFFVGLHAGIGRLGFWPQKIWVRMALTTTVSTRLTAMVLATARPMPTAPPVT